MAEQRVGIVMNGVTGRMGMNQHPTRGVAALRAEGGLRLRSGNVLMPDPILVGRDENKSAALARAHGVPRWTTDLDAARNIRREKPTADSPEDAVEVARLAKRRGIERGAVQDKLFLPGIRKLKLAAESGFVGRVLSVRGELRGRITGSAFATGWCRRETWCSTAA